MIFNSFEHPFEVVDMLTDVWVECVISILVEGFAFNVRADVVIDTLSDVQVDVTIDVSDIGVEVLTDVTDALIVGMTDLQFVMSAP